MGGDGKANIGTNPFLDCLLNPWTGTKSIIPDFEPNNQRYARRLLYNANMSGATDYLLVVTQFNQRQQLTRYVKATITDDCAAYGTWGFYNPNIRPLQLAGDWIWAGVVSPEENLGDNYAMARGVSGGYEVISNTVAAGAFAVAGQVHAVSSPQLFDFRRLEGTSLMKFRESDGAYITGVPVATGIKGIVEPIVTPMLPIGTDANDIGAYAFDVTYRSGLSVGETAGLIFQTAPAEFFPNESNLGGVLYGQLVAGEHFPFGLCGRTRISGSSTRNILAASGLWLSYYTNERDDGSASPTPVAHYMAASMISGPNPSSVSCVFEFTTHAPILGIEFWQDQLSGTVGLGNFASINIRNSEFLQPGFVEPLTLINVEAVDPTMKINVEYTGNFEVIPTANSQSIARDIQPQNNGVDYHVDDIKSATLPFRYKDAFRFSLMISLKDGMRYHTAYAAGATDRRLLAGYAGGLWSKIADLAKGLWGAVKPGLKQWAIERIGGAAGAFYKPGRASGRGRPSRRSSHRAPVDEKPVTSSKPIRRKQPKTVSDVRLPPTPLLMDDTGFVDIIAYEPDGFSAENSGAARVKSVGFASGRKSKKIVNVEEKKQTIIDPTNYDLWPTLDDISRYHQCKKTIVMRGPTKECPDFDFAVAHFPIIYSLEVDGEVDASAVITGVLTVEPVQYADGKFAVYGANNIDVRLINTGAAEDIITPSPFVYFTLQQDMPVSVIEDESYALSLHLARMGTYTDMVISGIPFDDSYFGEPEGYNLKYQAARAFGKQLLIGSRVESGDLPPAHPLLEPMDIREAMNLLNYEYEVACVLMLHEGLNVRRGAEFGTSNKVVLEKPHNLESKQEAVAAPVENLKEAVVSALNGRNAALEMNVLNRLQAISNKQDIIRIARGVLESQRNEKTKANAEQNILRTADLLQSEIDNLNIFFRSQPMLKFLSLAPFEAEAVKAQVRAGVELIPTKTVPKKVVAPKEMKGSSDFAEQDEAMMKLLEEGKIPQWDKPYRPSAAELPELKVIQRLKNRAPPASPDFIELDKIIKRYTSLPVRTAAQNQAALGQTPKVEKVRAKTAQGAVEGVKAAPSRFSRLSKPAGDSNLGF